MRIGLINEGTLPDRDGRGDHGGDRLFCRRSWSMTPCRDILTGGGDPRPAWSIPANVEYTLHPSGAPAGLRLGGGVAGTGSTSR